MYWEFWITWHGEHKCYHFKVSVQIASGFSVFIDITRSTGVVSIKTKHIITMNWMRYFGCLVPIHKRDTTYGAL